jgi:SAM-dependent methyltransferase
LNVLWERAQKEGLEKNLTLLATGIEDEATDKLDLIFGIHFLHHSEDMGKTILCVSRRIRSGGRAVFLEPNPFNPYWYPYIWLNKARSWQAEKGILKCRPGRVARIFRQSGFRQVQLHTYGIVPIPLINRYHSLWKMESILNTVPALRWISAVQIIYGVKE